MIAAKIELEAADAAVLDARFERFSPEELSTFSRLYDYGEITERSPSEADWKLLCLIGKLTRDPGVAERLARSAAIASTVDMWSGGKLVGTDSSRAKKWDRLVKSQVAKALRATARTYQLAESKAPQDHLADAEPLDVTVAALAEDPALLQGPEAISPWLTWRGQLTLLVGREKLAGKSTLAASDAARAAKAGHTVLWVDAEQGHNRVVSRFVSLGAPLDRLVTLRRWPQAWAEVEDVITRRHPDAIYIDSVSSFLMAVEGKVPETSEGEKWQALVGRFKQWTQLGPRAAGVCGLLHATKADGNYRGSTGIGAAPDVILTMRTDPQDTARRWLDCIGRWGFPSRCVRFEGEAKGYASLDGALPPAGPGPKMSETRHKVLTALTGTMTWGEWREAYGGNQSTFNHAIAWLRTEGLVHLEDATGKYSRDEFAASQVPVGGSA